MPETIEASGVAHSRTWRLNAYLGAHALVIAAATFLLLVLAVGVLAVGVIRLGTVDTTTQLSRHRGEQALCIAGYQDDFLKATGNYAVAANQDDDAAALIAKNAFVAATANLDRDRLAQLCPAVAKP